MAKELKSGEKSVGDLTAVTFDSPKAKDEFPRKMAQAKTNDEIADLLTGDADPSAIN